MPAPETERERELNRLVADVKRLESEYNMYFAGRLPRPPLVTRSRVESAMKRFDRTPFQNTGEKFRFVTLQSRFAALVDLWDRSLRAREEGRRGPFASRKSPPEKEKLEAPDPKVVHVAAFRDPMQEMDKLHDLYDSLVEARRQVGADSVPFQRFADLVKNQVTKLQESGGTEVAFKVSVQDGKVNFTARALRGRDEPS
jgi:hypothetical protein